MNAPAALRTQPEDPEAWARDELREVEQALEAWVPADARRGWVQAMRYGVLDGGKRLRPLLVLAACEAVGGLPRGSVARGGGGGTDPRLQPGARRHALHGQRRAAPRQAHGARAVRRGPGHAGRRRHAGPGLRGADACRRHDGSPLGDGRAPSPRCCRRGWWGCWRAPPAMPAWPAARPSTWPASASRWTKAHPARHAPPQDRRLAAGQRADGRGLRPCTPHSGARCRTTAAALGLAFQVVDDILDVTQASATLGKTAGKDQDNNKPTYVTVLGLGAARAHAEALRRAGPRGAAASGLGPAAACWPCWPTRWWSAKLSPA
jgi:farnesyl diphosphate synthase